MKMLNALFQGDSEIVPVTPCHTCKRGRGVVENANIPHVTVGRFRLNFDEHFHRGDLGMANVARIHMTPGIISYIILT